LFENVFPRRSLFYEKIVQAEWKEKNLFNFLFRSAAYFIQQIVQIESRAFKLVLTFTQKTRFLLMFA